MQTEVCLVAGDLTWLSEAGFTAGAKRGPADPSAVFTPSQPGRGVGVRNPSHSWTDTVTRCPTDFHVILVWKVAPYE